MAEVTIAPPAVPMRPLGVAELLDSAVRLVRHNPRASFATAFPIAVVRSGILAVLMLATVESSDFATVQLLLQVFISALFGTILAGLLAPVYTGDLLGRRLTAAQSLRQVGGRGFALVALALVVALAQEVGVVVLFIGGAWLWGVWAVAAPALAVERLGVGRALSRSYQLVRTEFWRTWGIRSLRWVLVGVLGFLVSIPFTALAAVLSDSNLFDETGSGIQNPGIYVTIAAVGNLVALTLTTPISAAVDSLLYTDLRMRREGLDLVMGLPPVPADARRDEHRQVIAW